MKLAFGIVIVARGITVYRRFWNAYESGTLMWLNHTYSVGIARRNTTCGVAVSILAQINKLMIKHVY